MNILITGGRGLLGSECAQVLADSHQVRALGSRDLDITSPQQVARAFSGIHPDVVVNCAAMTAVDDCETERERAWMVNVVGARNLAAACHRYGCVVLHLSTNYIFDGRKPLPQAYAEDDAAAPLSFYGVTKLESERAVMTETNNYIIIRTAWLYGLQGGNFLKKILQRIAAHPGEDIPVVHDHFGAPTWAYRLALQMERLIAGGYRGIIHATAEGSCSWYELACFFLERLRVRHRIVPCAGGAYFSAARRPVNGLLENRRLKTSGIQVMTRWEDDVAAFAERFGHELLRGAGIAVP